MARPRSRRIASEDSDSGNAKDVGKKTKEKGISSTRKKKASTFVVSIPKTRVKLPSVEARAPRKLIIQNTSSSNSSPLPSSTVSYVNRPSFPSGHLSFKNKNYQSSGANVGKKRMWKNLKQIVAQIRLQNYKPNEPTYVSIEAPPSLLPSKRYSDISGLPAKYTDPLTGLRYASAQEFAFLRSLSPNLVQSYLSLRKAGHVVC